ncbi:hypothetical protein JYU14_02710 [Simkania negevensis]|uniref:Flagellin n=1 Tax=Simkania negevensis TaxID=83561 RepID=A0ABS3ATY2_9BACT|nr:hypothetical protein [Simkania negevensis]
MTANRRQVASFANAMNKIATGDRLAGGGESPADLGISERFRSQVANSEEAGRVIQNAVNMLSSADEWMGETHKILTRMNELAISASDGSKNEGDRKNLNLEFQQLKNEIGRISEAALYNGLQVNSETAVAVWDSDANTVVYTQVDGKQINNIGLTLASGAQAANNIHYAFESSALGYTGEFIFIEGGKSMLYMAQHAVSADNTLAQRTLMKLNLETNRIENTDLTSNSGTSANVQVHFVTDDQGRIWLSDPQTAGGAHNVVLLNTDDLTLDDGTAASAQWVGGVTLASTMAAFAVHGDHIFYVEDTGTDLNYVKQNMFDRDDKQNLLTDIVGDHGVALTERIAISSDGLYFAFKDDTSVWDYINIINTQTGKNVRQQWTTVANELVDFGFDENNNFYWTDTGNTSTSNAIYKATITTDNEGAPSFNNIQKQRQAPLGQLGIATSAIGVTFGGGLSITAQSPGAIYSFQVGPDAGMTVDFRASNATLTRLGVSKDDLLTTKSADIAIGNITKAIDKLAEQRSLVGAEVSRLGYIAAGNEGYANNIAAAESRIRDVDFVEEAALMAEAQVFAQASTSILAQFNASRQNVLQLLQ